MTRAIPAQLKPFLTVEEGRASVGYADGGGVPTIGIGHTGPEVRVGMKITPYQIDAYFDADALRAAHRLEGVVHADVIAALTDGEYAALLSFVFNAGAPPKATIWVMLNQGNLGAVPDELRRWVYDNGKKVQGLINRREAEIKLWYSDSKGAHT